MEFTTPVPGKAPASLKFALRKDAACMTHRLLSSFFPAQPVDEMAEFERMAREKQMPLTRDKHDSGYLSVVTQAADFAWQARAVLSATEPTWNKSDGCVCDDKGQPCPACVPSPPGVVEALLDLQNWMDDDSVTGSAAGKYPDMPNPPPDYKDLWDAFVAGASEARGNPSATVKHFALAADAYCKLVHREKAPEMFAWMGMTCPRCECTKITKTETGFHCNLCQNEWRPFSPPPAGSGKENPHCLKCKDAGSIHQAIYDPPEQCDCQQVDPPEPVRHPFNLARAVRGDALVTRGGETLEGFVFSEYNDGYRIHSERLSIHVNEDGKFYSDGRSHPWDLFMRDPEPPADNTVLAQHEETGHTWKGPRENLPERYFIVSPEDCSKCGQEHCICGLSQEPPATPPVPEEVYSEAWKLCAACNGTGFRPGSGYPDGSDCDVCGGRFQPVIHPKEPVPVTDEWCLRYADKEAGHEVGAGGPPPPGAQSGDECREAFECVVTGHHKGVILDRKSDGEYRSWTIENEWVLWKAGAAWARQQASPPADGKEEQS